MVVATVAAVLDALQIQGPSITRRACTLHLSYIHTCLGSPGRAGGMEKKMYFPIYAVVTYVIVLLRGPLIRKNIFLFEKLREKSIIASTSDQL